MRIGRVVAGGVAVVGLSACGDDSPPAATAVTATAGVTTTATLMTATTALDGSTSVPTTTAADPTTSAPTTSADTTGDDVSTGAATTSGADSSGGQMSCDAGELVCDGDTAVTCDGRGGVLEEKQCERLCVPTFGCVHCVPDSATCEGPVSVVCSPDGQVLEDIPCDPVQGLSCDPETGRCAGACAPDGLGSSYIGCDYFATVTPNIVAPMFSFAVAVSNTSGAVAHVTISRDGDTLDEVFVPADTVEVVALPWIPALKAPTSSALVQGGAYRVRSDQPVIVYQYSPVEYQKLEQFSHSNDASLLLPTNVWGKATRVVARNTLLGQPGAYAVVAWQDGTVVEVTPSATGAPVLPGGGVAANGHGAALLNEGDVLLVISGVGGGTPDVADLTGTLVSADHPVQVIGAHACTNVPYDKPACDHLEESNLPLGNLATTYLLTTPLIKPPGMAPLKKARLVRIVATADATALSYAPPQLGAPTKLLKAGDYAEFVSDRDFQLTASSRVAVAEYMLGQSAGGNTGDPAMTIAVPPALFRDHYVVHAPTTYESNFANLIAPNGAEVVLDDALVPQNMWTPIGATGWSAARLGLAGQQGGDHVLESLQPFGVQVYGYGQYTSYWYPGGLDLDPL